MVERQAVNQARVVFWKTDRSRQEGADAAEVRGDGMDKVVLGSQWCSGQGDAGIWVVLVSGDALIPWPVSGSLWGRVASAMSWRQHWEVVGCPAQHWLGVKGAEVAGGEGGGSGSFVHVFLLQEA